MQLGKIEANADEPRNHGEVMQFK